MAVVSWPAVLVVGLGSAFLAGLLIFGSIWLGRPGTSDEQQ